MKVNSILRRTVDEPEWSPEDYILDGSPCPIHLVALQLDRIRRRTGHHTLVLVTYDARAVLKTLCVVSCRTGRLRDRAVRALEASKLRGVTPPGADLRSAIDLVVGPLGLDWLAPESEGANACLYERHGVGHTLSVAAVGFGRARKPIDREDLRPLHLSVNATIFAELRRDHVTQLAVSRAAVLQLTPESDRADRYDRSLDALLRLAADVTDGEIAAYYALDGRLGALSLATAVPEGASPVIPSRVDAGRSANFEAGSAEGIISKCLWSRPTAFGLLRADVNGSPGRRMLAAAAVPSLALDWQGPSQGVVAVWTESQVGGRRIDANQLTWLRNVGLRIAHLETSSRSEDSAEVISSMATELARRQTTVEWQPKPSRRRATDNFEATLPHDVVQCIPLWQEMVHRVHAATRSASVTVRALATRAAGNKTEVILVRCAASSRPEPSAEPDQIITVTGTDRKQRPQHESSLNAYAAYFGRSVYLYDASGRTPFETQGAPGLFQLLKIDGRPAIGSTFCTPIFVSGRIVGTMNLESPFPDAYAALVDSIKAFGALAGLALAVQRFRILESISNWNAAHSLSGHDREHLLTELSKLSSENLIPPDVIDVDGLKDRLISSGKAIDFREPDEPDRNLRELLQDVLNNRARLRKTVPAIEVFGPSKPTVSGQSSNAIAKAFDEILENAAEHGVRRVPVTVRISNTKLAGRTYLSIHIDNQIDKLPQAETLSRLFSAPVEIGDGRPHLGCYLAGTLVRSVGGLTSAHLLQSGALGPPVFRVQVLVPREEPQ